MLARVSNRGIFAMLAFCFAMAGTRTATAQALCAVADVHAFDAGFLRDSKTIMVQTDLGAFRGTLPGGTWRMNPGGPAWDGIALEGVSFTQNPEAETGANFHTFHVEVALRAWGSVVTDLEFIAIDGERSLSLGTLPAITVHCEATSVTGKLSITDRDFVAFFAGEKAPMLRVRRTTRPDGC